MPGKGKGLAIGKKTDIVEKPVTGNDDDNVIDQSASGAANRINGGDGNDNITGSALADRVNAGDGDDTVMGGAGDDVLFGNDGDDTAAYEGSIFNFTWEAGKGGTIVVTDSTGAEGTDTLKHFENLQFGDYTLDFDGNNAAMILGDDALSTDEDNAGSATITAWDFDGGTPAIDSVSVTGGGSVSATATSAGTAGMGTGTDINVNFDPGAAYQHLAVGESATETITVVVNDGQGNLSSHDIEVTIDGVNDDPTLGAGAMGATEDGAVEVLDLSALGDDIDNDDDGSTLTYTVTGTPAEGSASIAGTALSFDPGSEFQDLAVGETRDVVVEVTATDQHGASAVNNVTITVTGTNDAPTLAAAATAAIEDGASVDVDLAALGDDVDSDDDGSTLTYSVSGNPAEGSASISGTTLTFDPGSDFQDLAVGETRDVTIQVTAEDAHGATAVNDVTVTVTGTNDTPTASAIFANTNEDAGTFGLNLLSTANDVDTSDDLDVANVGVTSSDGRAVAYSVDAETGAFSFDAGQFNDLAVGESETVTVTYDVVDGNGGVVANTAEITVEGRNDAPSVSSAIVVGEGEEVLIDFNNITTYGNYHEDGYTFTLAPGTHTDGQYNGTFYWHDGGANPGDNDIVLTKDDGESFDIVSADIISQSGFQIRSSAGNYNGGVNGVNVAIGLNDITSATFETAGSTILDNMVLRSGGGISEDAADFSVDLLQGASDPDTSDVLNVANLSVTSGNGAGVVQNGNSLDVSPNAYNYLAEGETETIVVSYDIVDGNGGVVAQTATINIAGENDAPTATGGTGSVTEDGTLVANGSITVSDPDANDTHSFSIQGGGAGTYGTMSVDANGNWTYNLNNGAANVQALDSGQSVVDSFVFNVDDGNGGVTTANVDVTVNGADDGTTHVMNFSGWSHYGWYEDGMYMDTPASSSSHYHQHGSNIEIHGGSYYRVRFWDATGDDFDLESLWVSGGSGFVTGSNGAQQWVGYGHNTFGSNFEDLDWVDVQAYSWMRFDNFEFTV